MTIQSFLASLGSTKEEVAARLVEMGIKGRRNLADSCPVANAANDHLPPRHWGYYVHIQENSQVKLNSLVAPDPVRDFVLAFDAGEFPELDVNGGAAGEME